MEPNRHPMALAPVRAQIPQSVAENAVRGLGPGARASRALVEAGQVPPDVLAAMTLLLLAGQARAREPRQTASGTSASGERGAGRGVAGSVWVRERFAIHRPVRLDEPLVVTGAVQRSEVRKGRRFSVTTSETRDERGALLVSSCTTGLVRYRRDPGLEDGAEGVAEGDLPAPGPDHEAAAGNPSADGLRALSAGDSLRGTATAVTLGLMRARDGGQSRNPIHTDEQAAREAGLPAPIVGGSHVFGFLQEVLLDAWGPEALCHGAYLDLRWLSQVRAGASVEPGATVSAARADGIDVALEVGCEGRLAMAGSLAIPLAPR